MKFFSSISRVRVVLFIAAALSMLWGYRLLLLEHAPGVFNGEMEDLSYGWYVPVFSLYVLWRTRRELLLSVGEASPWGVLISLPFFFVGFLGAAGSQIRFEIIGFVGVLQSLILAFFGRRTAKLTLFPVLFLLFCLPLHSFLDLVTIHLRLFAVTVSYILLKGFGADIICRGTMLFSSTGSFSIDVAEPCSGLRSLFALMALTAGYAYFNQPTWTRRLALFALSIPIAIIGNVARILSVAVVAMTCSANFATGFYHDYSGYVVFLVAVSFMVGAGEMISRISSKVSILRKPPAEGNQNIQEQESVKPGAKTIVVSLVSFLLAVSVMSYQGLSLEPVLCEAPNVHLGDIEGYTYEQLSASQAELTVLPSDTRIEKRRYFGPDGEWYLAEIVVGGRHKSSIHRPEMCLPSQGFRMSNPRTRNVSGVDWRILTIARRDAPLRGFAYTFFNQAGVRTASHVERIARDVWDRSLLRRIDRWVMVTVDSSQSDEKRLMEFLDELWRALK
jgi:exosortase